jgi:acyl carrier protein
MSEVWQKMNEVILDYLFEIGDISITPETKLGEIPDWDSISAVSIQMLIHETFHVDLPLDLLRKDTTLSELITLVEQPDKISETIDKFKGRK